MIHYVYTMPHPFASKCRLTTHPNGRFVSLYTALLLLSLHYSVVVYINSSYLEQFVSHESIGMLYGIGAVLTLGALLIAPRLLARYGNYAVAIGFSIIELIALIALAYASALTVIIAAFLIHLVCAPLILYTLDIFMEELIGKTERITGSRRGLFLTIASFTAASATLCMGYILGPNEPNFSRAYLISALFLVPFMLLLFIDFRCFINPPYRRISLYTEVKQVLKDSDIRSVLGAYFLLQFFFAWMVIYTPLYLAQTIGFSWTEIGHVLFVALMAYVLLEYLIGYMADTWWGEKEMMIIGFVIMAIATSWFLFLHTNDILLWMCLLFMTRVGASLVEVTTESYFFKHTEGKEANKIGFFRIAQPLGYAVGAVVGILTLSFFSFDFLFLILSSAMFIGVLFGMRINDTK